MLHKKRSFNVECMRKSINHSMKNYKHRREKILEKRMKERKKKKNFFPSLWQELALRGKSFICT
jgi:hypothetical protein